MKKIIFSLVILSCFSGYSQSYESDLFEVKEENTLKSFRDSENKKMTVKSFITVGGKDILEYSVEFKKTIFNSNMFNFKLDYTDNYVFNDYDKARGRYKLNNLGLVIAYERTDFGGKKGLILGTEYHNINYKEGIVAEDRIRYKEYYNVGSVGMDTVVTVDYLKYDVSINGDTLKQKEMNSSSNTIFSLKNNLIQKQTNVIKGFSSEVIYAYDSSNRLIQKIFLTISNDTNESIKNTLKLTYNSDGLLSKTEFFDQTNTILEKKIFSYK